MLEQITSQEFRSLQETPLTLEVNGRHHAVQVAEVREFPAHHARPEPPFSVTLLAHRELLFSQGIYRLHLPTRGALDVFMVPLGPDARGMRYEIIFN
jgi:hypothetical protein